MPHRVIAKNRERGCDLPRREGGRGSNPQAKLACSFAPTCSTGGQNGLSKNKKNAKPRCGVNARFSLTNVLHFGGRSFPKSVFTQRLDNFSSQCNFKLSKRLKGVRRHNRTATLCAISHVELSERAGRPAYKMTTGRPSILRPVQTT